MLYSRIAFLTKRISRLYTGRETKTLLGRWSIVGEEDLFLRSDRSNEDHCGLCGEYIDQKLRDQNVHLNTTSARPSSNAFRKYSSNYTI